MKIHFELIGEWPDTEGVHDKIYKDIDWPFEKLPVRPEVIDGKLLVKLFQESGEMAEAIQEMIWMVEYNYYGLSENEFFIRCNLFGSNDPFTQFNEFTKQ
jgi:hypothetical protein